MRAASAVPLLKVRAALIQGGCAQDEKFLAAVETPSDSNTKKGRTIHVELVPAFSASYQRRILHVTFCITISSLTIPKIFFVVSDAEAWRHYFPS